MLRDVLLNLIVISGQKDGVIDHCINQTKKKDYTEFLKDVYITRVLDFMNPRDDTGKLILPTRKPMKSQMNNLK